MYESLQGLPMLCYSLDCGFVTVGWGCKKAATPH